MATANKMIENANKRIAKLVEQRANEFNNTDETKFYFLHRKIKRMSQELSSFINWCYSHNIDMDKELESVTSGYGYTRYETISGELRKNIFCFNSYHVFKKNVYGTVYGIANNLKDAVHLFT